MYLTSGLLLWPYKISFSTSFCRQKPARAAIKPFKFLPRAYAVTHCKKAEMGSLKNTIFLVRNAVTSECIDCHK